MKYIITSDIKIKFENIGEYKFYFIGILGSGMSAIAKFLKLKGAQVFGSDRGYSNFKKTNLAIELENIGCQIYNQNGKHLEKNIDYAVVSTAIERDNPDVVKAIEYNIPIIHRADLLAYIVNQNKTITIAGTSGKSTTTGIIGYLLKKSGINVNIMTGAAIKKIGNNNETSNCVVGASDIFIIETDESDGTIVKYKPNIAVLTNVSKDHKTIEELKILFQEYVNNAEIAVLINIDDKLSLELDYSNKKTIKIGMNKEADYRISNITEERNYTSFLVNNNEYLIQLPGIYNVYNSAFAIAIAEMFDIEYELIKSILSEFEGVSDRYEFYRNSEPTILYDYAHNPAKIDAVLGHLSKFYKKILFIYQPHGYQPTYFLKDELYKVFENYFFNDSHKIILKEIYYAGGTVEKKITSEQIVEELKKKNVNIAWAVNDEFIIEYIKKVKDIYDVIVIAGARDPKLRALCENIAELFNN